MRRFEHFTIEELEHMKSSMAYGKLHDEICSELELRETLDLLDLKKFNNEMTEMLNKLAD